MSTQFARVEGLRELDTALAALPGAVGRKVVQRALRRAARPVADEAKARVRRQTTPTRRGGVRIGSRTANKWGFDKSLAQSIAVRTDMKAAQSPSETFLAIGPARSHFYGAFVERGTAARPGRPAQGRSTYLRRTESGEIRIGFTRSRKGRRGHAATRSYPFMRPAWEMHQGRIVDVTRLELWSEIERFANRVARRQMRWTQAEVGP